MRIKREIPEKFVPFVLSILVETEDEAAALFAIANSSRASRVLPFDAAEKMKEEIGDRFYRGPGETIIGNVKYSDFYDKPQIDPRAAGGEDDKP